MNILKQSESRLRRTFLITLSFLVWSLRTAIRLFFKSIWPWLLISSPRTLEMLAISLQSVIQVHRFIIDWQHTVITPLLLAAGHPKSIRKSRPRTPRNLRGTKTTRRLRFPRPCSKNSSRRAPPTSPSFLRLSCLQRG